MYDFFSRFPRVVHLSRFHRSWVIRSLPRYLFVAYLNNDIAVVRLKLGPGEGVRMSRYIKPACLPSPSAGYLPGTECTISGWGSINQGSGGYSRRLQAATVPILAAEQCMQKHVYGPDKLTKGMFCAGGILEMS